MPTAAEVADAQVAVVREDRSGRLALMRSLYEAAPGRAELHLPYRRAALAFMDWELRRGLLNPPGGAVPGSPWWRAVNERLLRDTAEARAHVLGLGGPVSSSSVVCAVDFVQRPSARTWYRAHNSIIVRAYLEHRELAEAESRVERFFINLVLVRVLYAHAMVAAPRLAMSWLWPIGPVLGDPRLMMTGIFPVPLARATRSVPAARRPAALRRPRARLRPFPRCRRDPPSFRRVVLLVGDGTAYPRARRVATGLGTGLRMEQHRHGGLGSATETVRRCGPPSASGTPGPGRLTRIRE